MKLDIQPSVILEAAEAMKPHLSFMEKDDAAWREKMAEATLRAGLNEMNRLKPPIKKMGITERQKECLEIITAYIEEHGASPSFQDLRHAMNMTQASIHRIVHGLCDRGRIKMMPGRARSITVL